MIIHRVLNDLADWKDFLKNDDSIIKIINSILDQCNIDIHSVKRIEFGTNAVFDLGNYILKIYAVNEKSSSELDCIREIILSKLLMPSYYRVPSIIKTGHIEDRYTIYYIIMEKFNCLVPVRNVLSDINSVDYTIFLKELHAIINYIHSLKVDSNIISLYSKPIMGELSKCNEYVQYVNNYLFNNRLEFGIVHGDLSETNIYFNKEGEIIILDFEDWMYAPFIAEYPTICFELLKTPNIINDFFSNIAKNNLIEMLIAGILLHHESTRFLKIIASKIGNNTEFPSLKEMQLFLSNWLS